LSHDPIFNPACLDAIKDSHRLQKQDFTQQ